MSKPKLQVGDVIYWIPMYGMDMYADYPGVLHTYDPDKDAWTIIWDDGEDTGDQLFASDQCYRRDRIQQDYFDRRG